MPVGHSGYLQARCSQKLVGRLLDRTCDVVSRIGGPLIFSESAICHSPSLFPPSILAAHDSTPLHCTQTHMFLFLFQWCAGTSLLETWISAKALSFLVHCLKYCFPEGTGPWPRGVRADPWARTTARTEVCMPITRFMGG